MPAVKVDVTGVEDSTFSQPQPGIYNVVVDKQTKIGESKSGNLMLTLVMKITEGEFKNSLLWHYVLLHNEATGSILKQALIALKLISGKKTTANLDPDKIVGTHLKVRVKEDTYNGEYKAKVVGLYPLDDADDKDSESFDDPSYNDSSDADVEDYDSWTVGELKAELKDRELEFTGKKSDLVNRLLASDVPF